jgi:hypothetical protein
MTDTPEDIVRALATKEAPVSEVTGECDYCGEYVGSFEPRLGRHGASCPWRRAVEWVEANPK